MIRRLGTQLKDLIPLGLSAACSALIAIAILAAATAYGAPAGKDGPFVKKGDIIVFMGDSITVASTSANGFATLIGESLKKNLPDGNVQIHSAAKGGCGIKYLHTIFDSKVAVHKPSIVVILIGINDVRLQDKTGADPAEYQALLKKLVDRCKGIGAKTVICSPIMRGEKTDGSNQYDKLIGEYVEAGRKVAGDSSSIFVDLRALFMERLKAVNKENKEEGNLSKDGVHPNAAGNELIANAILQAWSVPAARK
ncbi:MAG: hypothetical protein A2X48_09985 [Lentisphaerae bacterium GWF2_49_21]|nr:MAG: hypothetical protein A2X48_09985 [Lentisphaerae bacterium GWF2_49_21]